MLLKLFQGLGQAGQSPPTGRECWPATWLSQEQAVSLTISWDMGIQHDTHDCLSAQFFSESESDQSKRERESPLASLRFKRKSEYLKNESQVLTVTLSMSQCATWFSSRHFHLSFCLIRNLHNSREKSMFHTAQVCAPKDKLNIRVLLDS